MVPISYLSDQQSAFSLQPSAFSLQPSAFSLQPSALALAYGHATRMATLLEVRSVVSGQLR
ncbi:MULTISPECIES: hypothetical protein [Moorena]|uniref:Uncharacterized protein n=1 Tax=Moorena producens (strain JHB) TaxID=1454205 RepID=A0A9Q9SUR2_MOOP1|nr:MULTISPECIES: hypothetical protein [Moorena]NEQ14134.1 hypothetical protein [Moorena sp. SIO3E2]NEP68851.1 hypothetical protein [Moorena sp. SIO3A5]NER90770.1 hypothetical protein [Moorena sp. SIO3A2]NES41121.1 hypothetical protein [Moorena sp. SIO2C4]WAN70013.1 hypothetical protein BJP36_38755 [Moorena producens JHB]